jgi:uncharacterized protein (DUF736 family)
MAEKEYKESIGALWKKKSKTGVVYLSGVLQKGQDGKKTPIVIFANKKAKDTHPDYRIFLSDPLPQSSEQSSDEAPEVEVSIDDIPF